MLKNAKFKSKMLFTEVLVCESLKYFLDKIPTVKRTNGENKIPKLNKCGNGKRIQNNIQMFGCLIWFNYQEVEIQPPTLL